VQSSLRAAKLLPSFVTTQPIIKLTTSSVADTHNAAACYSSFSSYALGPSFTPLAPNDADATSRGGEILNDLWGGGWNFQMT
jgi:hypothetical protein